MASASVDRTAAGSGELADKITNIKKGKTDFGYSYAEAKKEENSLNRDRFDWEKSNHMSNHESQMKIMKFKQESDSNTEIMKALIAAGKSPDECAEYLQKFKNMSSH
jgi:flagellar basal body P-ring protein FlgI